jgi:hypothetical protein
VGERFADTADPTLKASSRTHPFKTAVRARVRDFASHYLLPLCSHLAPRALLHPQRRHLLRHQTARDSAAAMSNWTQSIVSRVQLLHLVEAGQLPPLTTSVEWKVPDDEFVPCPLRGSWSRS